MRTDNKTNVHTIIDRDLKYFIVTESQATGRRQSDILNELLRKAAAPRMAKLGFKTTTQTRPTTGVATAPNIKQTTRKTK